MSFLDTNYSLYSIPAMWLLSYYPVFRRNGTIQKTIGFDNVRVRQNISRLSEKKVDPELVAKVNRMNDAHANGVENLPFWGLAVVVANYAQLENRVLNLAAIFYLSSRCLYNFIYINQKTQAHGGMRGLTWATGLLFPFYLLIKSAGKIAAAGPV